MNSLITVIIPVYNVEKYLPRCLDSVIHQSYKNLEIILVDDGSTDSSGAICDQYALRDNRIKVLHKSNGGLSSARNAGLHQAHGDYISFVDSDDFIALEFIERLLRLITNNTADIAFCNYSLYCTLEPQVHTNPSGKSTLYVGRKAIMSNFYNHNCGVSVMAWGKLYKRELFGKIRFPEGRIYEDEATTYLVFYLAKKVVYLKAPLYFYYRRPDSITTKMLTEDNLSVLQTLQEVVDFYLHNNEKMLAHKAIIRLIKINAIYVYRAKKEAKLLFWEPAKEGISKKFAEKYKTNIQRYKMKNRKIIFDAYGVIKNGRS